MKANLLLFFSIFFLQLCSIEQLVAQDFFQEANAFFQEQVQTPHVAYAKIKANPAQLHQLIDQVANYELTTQEVSTQKAFWINAYNLLVIHAIIEKYPLRSPKDVPGFFDRQVYLVAGEKMTLNDLEQKKILRVYQDPRVHFALVCGAKGCPPLQAEAYFPERLEKQLDQATRLAINDANFIRREAGEVKISPIFRWYASDFGNIRSFLNQYLESPLDAQSNLRFYIYDWALNEASEGKAFQLPFRATVLLQRGEAEVKIFNSVYTQTNKDGFSRANSRSTYFSIFGQALFGVNEKWNLGFDLVYKSNVLNDFSAHSPFEVLKFQQLESNPLFSCQHPNYNIAENSICSLDPSMHPEQTDSLRNFSGEALNSRATIGLSHFGPKFKINPFRRWQNLSWQQTFYIPIQKRVDGQYISFSQFFYDRSIGSRFQLFSEISLWTIVAPKFRVFPAVKVFYSYFPNRRWTVYAMTSIPVEYGLGTKFQLSKSLEIELLYTHYLPIEFLLGDAQPSTFNLGFRYRR